MQKTGHGGGLAGLVENLLAAVIADHDLARDAALFLEQGDDVFLALGTGLDRHLGAANTDRGHRRAYLHGVRPRLGDRARNEGEHTLDDGEGRIAFVGFGVVDQLVENHAALFAQRESGVVDEDDADRAFAAGLDDVALKDRGASAEGNFSAVGPDHGDAAGNGLNRADGLGLFAGCRLGVLTGSHRTGQLVDQVGRHLGATRGHQGGRIVDGVIVPNDDFAAVLALDDKVRPRADEIRRQHHGAARYRQMGSRADVQDDGLATLVSYQIIRRDSGLKIIDRHGSPHLASPFAP